MGELDRSCFSAVMDVVDELINIDAPSNDLKLGSSNVLLQLS